MTSTSSILWQNEARSVFLIDIPRSISDAQSNGVQHYSRNLLSSPPLQSPYPSNEPKSQAARARFKSSIADSSTKLHQQYHHTLQNALDEIAREFKGEWCHPRPFTESLLQKGKKRSLDQDPETAPLSAQSRHNNISGPQNINPDVVPLHEALPNLDQPCDLVYRLYRPRETLREPVKALPIENFSPFPNFINNDNGEEVMLSLHDTSIPGRTSTFYLPPRSKFYLGDCKDSRTFHQTLDDAQSNDTQTQGQQPFDFILLDPPWPNRSVRRTHKTAGSTYTTISTLPEMQKLLLDMNLPPLMADDSLVGIWITNKPAMRNLILDAKNGIFAHWNLEPVEEWLWLKTTVAGVPVFPLDGLWRKPYEVLLLGRRRSSSSSLSKRKVSDIVDLERTTTKRRVLVSVPDLHSRKPCLKALIEPMLSHPTSYRALEIFARHLVSGWYSWGNECIRFNWEGYWQTAERNTTHVDSN